MFKLPTHYLEVNQRTLKVVVSYGSQGKYETLACYHIERFGLGVPCNIQTRLLKPKVGQDKTYSGLILLQNIYGCSSASFCMSIF
jgi:hypothetical protein